jgi:alpha-tubulin suppressor-like RCC1 family protein
MPNFSGKWTLTEQGQAVAAQSWPSVIIPELYTWGYNNQGQLGLGDTVTRESPVQVAGTNWAATSGLIEANNGVPRAIQADGSLFTWGNNVFGTVGDNTVVLKSSPVQVGSEEWYAISSGRGFGLFAIKPDKSLWAWGYNANGQLGDGTVISRSSPVQIGALTNWEQVSTSSYHTAAVKTDGTLWTWGRGNNGVTGHDNTVNLSSPVQVGALSNWARVGTCFGDFVTAVKTDGTLWAWGLNNLGQLGDGTVISKSSPVQIGALTNWLNSAHGDAFSVAVKTDGTFWAWGKNASGQLGDNTNVSKSSPVQVGALTDWVKGRGGSDGTMAIRSSGGLYFWGQSAQGSSGLPGGTVRRSSPTQIGTNDWLDFSMAVNVSMGTKRKPI